jgi:hypothetical protein
VSKYFTPGAPDLPVTSFLLPLLPHIIATQKTTKETPRCSFFQFVGSVLANSINTMMMIDENIRRRQQINN